ncbi:MAG: phosphosulfolactate synthase, partial [Acidimicrobiia bacterium]|nr:phosphosulfolactate synthase [Acidimicrobiia bacterium]
MRTRDFVDALGVRELSPATSALDPGYSPLELESHLEQSGHLLSTLKISMACWLIANETSTRAKTEASRRHGVTTVTGGGPFEVSVAQGVFEDYLDLCADIGVDRIESGEGFTEMHLSPESVVSAAAERGLDVQFELG